jgi:hypothetical protein
MLTWSPEAALTKGAREENGELSPVWRGQILMSMSTSWNSAINMQIILILISH